MNLLAIKMLVGDRAKYLGIISGLTFAAVLMVQQAGIFYGFIRLTYSSIHTIPQATIWVADPDVRFIDDSRPLLDSALLRVRGVEGVKWAVPYFKGAVRCRLPDGRNEVAFITGVDETSFIGAPQQMIEGSIENMRQSQGIIIDQRTANNLFARRDKNNPDAPRIPLKTGDILELNDQRATIVGICKTVLQLQGEATIYTTFNRATASYTPTERRKMTYVLAAPDNPANMTEVVKGIEKATQLRAFTVQEFKDRTWTFFVTQGGFGVFFGISVLFGFIIGIGIAGQMFYNFTVDNLKYFAVLKAMGTSSWRLIRMVMLQATLAGVMGWSLGIAIGALFGWAFEGSDQLLFEIPWELFFGSMATLLFISWLSALLSIRSVLKLDPAVVFK
jgi:putative ABC transport system permease protein